jgi:hypothetical protein
VWRLEDGAQEGSRRFLSRRAASWGHMQIRDYRVAMRTRACAGDLTGPSGVLLMHFLPLAVLHECIFRGAKNRSRAACHVIAGEMRISRVDEFNRGHARSSLFSITISTLVIYHDTL